MLFNINYKHRKPLAEICRPMNCDEVVGQEHIWREGSPLKKIVEKKAFSSLLFWGPPGTGKTSLAGVISKYTGFKSIHISAVSTTVKEIRAAISESDKNLKSGGSPVILFLDEIHRLNKGQQDVLLPAIENGVIKLIGATTENPSFEVNNAILSRSITFRFHSVTKNSLSRLITNATKIFNAEYGTNFHLGKNTLNIILDASSGDARYAINLLDLILSMHTEDSSLVEIESIASLGIDLKLAHDKKGDSHYDLASALIKSLRASHPDASLYYLARLIEGGEDPSFIARRLLIFASEDVGNANPTALSLATSAMQAVKMLGMPEARITLAQITTYLACSPKSNKSYEAINKAIAHVKRSGSLSVPAHLKNAPNDFLKAQGNSNGYIYPHESANYKNLSYLPDEISGTCYYTPSASGVEAKFNRILAELRPSQD